MLLYVRLSRSYSVTVHELLDELEIVPLPSRRFRAFRSVPGTTRHQYGGESLVGQSDDKGATIRELHLEVFGIALSHSGHDQSGDLSGKLRNIQRNVHP